MFYATVVSSSKWAMHLNMGMTACAAEMSNNYSFKPVDAEVYAE